MRDSYIAKQAVNGGLETWKKFVKMMGNWKGIYKKLRRWRTHTNPGPNAEVRESIAKLKSHF
jgi:hypothetical protein